MYLFAIIHPLRRFQQCLFSAPGIFIPDVYATKNRPQKPAPENGVDLWRRFLEHVSWV